VIDDKRVHKYSQFGVKKWETRISIPIELYEDKDYLKHVKNELKERCIKEYISEVEDSFEYFVNTFIHERRVELSVKMDDLFDLKERNNRLRRELHELYNDYKVLKTSKESLL
jgi:hypothetical protein